ncbi:MAG TPA: hypothetical protein VIL35_12980 [Vicinamibacterales bacterium]
MTELRTGARQRFFAVRFVERFRDPPLRDAAVLFRERFDADAREDADFRRDAAARFFVVRFVLRDAARFVERRDPPRLPRVSPASLRALFTVRAAISSARSSPTPRSSSDSFTCSY